MAARAPRIPTYVLDANVIAPFVLPEAGSAESRDLFDAASAGSALLIAPSFWRIECGNVVWKYVHRRLLDAGDARAAFELLDALPIASIDTAILMDVALDVAITCDLTMYASLYVATALYADAPLLTRDIEVMRRIADIIDVRHIARNRMSGI